MSEFGDRFTAAFPRARDVLGDSLTYTNVEDQTTQSLKSVPNEFVGAVDEFGRKLFTFLASDLTVRTSGPERGDTITDDDGAWVIVDVRNDNAGTYEVRADIAQDRD